MPTPEFLRMMGIPSDVVDTAANRANYGEAPIISDTYKISLGTTFTGLNPNEQNLAEIARKEQQRIIEAAKKEQQEYDFRRQEEQPTFKEQQGYTLGKRKRYINPESTFYN